MNVVTYRLGLIETEIGTVLSYMFDMIHHYKLLWLDFFVIKSFYFEMNLISFSYNPRKLNFFRDPEIEARHYESFPLSMAISFLLQIIIQVLLMG